MVPGNNSEAAEWFYQQNNERKGPISEEEMPDFVMLQGKSYI